MVDSDRNSTSIICDSNGIIRIDRYVNGITESCQRLINRIINNLIYQMMKTS